MANSFHQSEGQLSTNLLAYIHACMQRLKWGATDVHCAHTGTQIPAPAAPTALCRHLGINALIESAAGQFCKCWDIKKATFYNQSGRGTKQPFTAAAFWTWLSLNRRGLIINDLMEPSEQMPSLFTQSGRAGSWPTVDLGFLAQCSYCGAGSSPVFTTVFICFCNSLKLCANSSEWSKISHLSIVWVPEGSWLCGKNKAKCRLSEVLL